LLEAPAAVELQGAYEQYLNRWPDNYGIRRDAALFLVRRGVFPQAAAELECLLAWEPANPTLRRVLAYTYRKTGRYREAAIFLKALLKEKPRDTALLLEYSGCLARVGAAPYAIAVLEKALDLFTQTPEIPLALGILLYREHQFERAFDLLREAAARAPRDPRPYRWMALMARKMGDAEGARRYDSAAKRRKSPG
jgi:Flp pilus assembly protein TadD